jgi:glycosyltransferase involved in cell wall biosynthesis
VLTTLYGYPTADLLRSLRAAPMAPLAALSEHQRGSIPHANWQATIPCALPSRLHSFHIDAGDHLAFVGAMSPGDGVERALAVAARCGASLRIAFTDQDRMYERRVLAPLIAACPARVEIRRSLDAQGVEATLAGARALLFASEWPEPCPLPMIEALAHGTPIIAWRRGAAPEIVEDEHNGFLVADVGGAVEAVTQIAQISRLACRRSFDDRYDVRHAAHRYLAIYRDLIRRADIARVVATTQWLADRELSRR